MTSWIAILIAAFVLVGCNQGGVLDGMLPHKDPAPVDFATLVRPDSPNTYLIAPAGFGAAKADDAAPVFAIPEAQLKEKFVAMIAREPRIELLSQSADGLQLQYVQRTRMVRFPDIIDVRFLPLEGGRSSLALYSRSVYGRSDLGVNKARAKAWVSATQ